MAEFKFKTVEEMAKDVAYKSIKEVEINGKTIQQWITEISKDSLTCVGLGVMTREEAKPYIKRFQLCR